MSKRITMGNLFFGSGAWELAAKICGIDVLWEAEIEPFPVAVEKARFPEATQLGDVSKISGADIPPVDIITNSSPCQDLSVAGKRAGLAGERSGLFAEAIRITKEMREKDAAERLSMHGTDDHIRPRFWAWENVPGALSSSGGEDFRRVLEEVARVVEEGADIPLPPKGWSYAGVVDGEGWQIAWRVMDARYWGVPQRRRRVFLIADFEGWGAAEVLFERQSVSWDFAKIREAWEDTARTFEERIDVAGGIVREGIRGEKGRVEDGCMKLFDNHGIDARYTGPVTVSQTLTQYLGTGGNNTPLVLETPKTLKIRCGKEGGGKGPLIQDDLSAILTTNNDQTLFEPIVHYCASHSSFFMDAQKEQANTLVATDYKDPPIVTDIVETRYFVRRLTPTECARLQGFPPDWAADIPHTDAAEYKMWGNGIALPCLLPMMKAMADILGGTYEQEEE